jgi:hypothetical protein
MLNDEQEKFLNFMRTMRDEFGEYQFRVTLADGTRLRSEKFRFKDGYKEITPATALKSIEKKR